MAGGVVVVPLEGGGVTGCIVAIGASLNLIRVDNLIVRTEAPAAAVGEAVGDQRWRIDNLAVVRRTEGSEITGGGLVTGGVGVVVPVVVVGVLGVWGGGEPPLVRAGALHLLHGERVRAATASVVGIFDFERDEQGLVLL